MTYAEAQDYLFALRTLGSKFGLERMRAFYEAVGSPCSAVPIVHVAGTNGKGSVCAMVEAAVRANGYKTGLFTSPHLLRLGERVQVNRTVLDEAQIIRYVGELKPVAERIAAGAPENHPTFFELMTVMALMHFEREACDVVIIETGLGGRLDSTNILQPAVTAITSIGLDHQEILGDTLVQIAREKAGIIKSGVPLVLGRLPQQAACCVREVAESLGVETLWADDYFCNTADAVPVSASSLASSSTASSISPSVVASPPTSPPASPPASVLPSASLPLSVAEQVPKPVMPVASVASGTGEHASSLPLSWSWASLTAGQCSMPYPRTSLAGEFQRRNAAVALLICKLLARRLPMDFAKALESLRDVQWAGRWQSLCLRDGSKLILDSSHNEEGARALEENLSRLVRDEGQPPVVITAALGAARARALLEVVAHYAAAVYLVEVGQPRACTTAQLRTLMPPTFTGAVHSSTVAELFPAESCISKKIRLEPGQTLLVTGSIYLIGEVLTRLHGVSALEATGLQDKLP